MGKVKKIVDGVVVEVDEQTMVKVIENGVVVEKPFREVKQQPSQSPTPEKKNVVGTSQPSPLRGIGGSSDLSVPSPLSASATPPKKTFGEGALEAVRTPEPKKQIPVPPKPIEGLGKQEAVSYGDKLAEDIVESAMNRPYELAKTAQQQIDSGDYVVNGKKVTEYELRSKLLDRGFVAEVNSQLREGTFQSSGILKLGKNASPETVALANHQIKSQGEFDEFKSLQSGLMGLNIGLTNMPNYLNLMMEQATGVPNAFFTTFMSVSPEMKQMAISGEAKDRLTKYVANLNKIKEGYSESKFKTEDPRAEKQSDFVDLFNQGKYGEMGRTIVNSTLESAPIMIGAAATAAMTGNPMTGAAFLVPQSASTRLADILNSKDIKVKGLTPSERLADVNISGMAEGIPEALMGPVVNKSFKLFKQGVQQGIKRIFEQGGKDAAIDAAEGAAKETAAKLIKNYGKELALGYGEEAATSTITEFKDVYLGTSDKTILEIIRTINNDGMIGSLSQGLISTPGTGIALANKAALNGRRLFDKKVSTPEGQEDLKEFSKQYAQKNGQNEQEVLASIEARIKAVNAVPKRLVDDTKTIDLVQEKQDLTEQMRNLDDAFKKPLADRIAKIEEEIAYRAERNEFIKKREALVGEIDGITDAPDGIKKAYQDFEEGKEVPLQDLQKASDWAYSELKRMRAMKGSPTSELSQERVDDYIDLLTRDVSAFEDKISELKNAEAEFLTEPVINSTPTDEKYASVNNNDGKGTVDLTKQEYLDWKAKNKPVTEQLTIPKTEQNAKEQQGEQMREQGVQEQPQGESDSNMPIVNQTELQDGQTPQEKVVGAVDVDWSKDIENVDLSKVDWKSPTTEESIAGHEFNIQNNVKKGQQSLLPAIRELAKKYNLTKEQYLNVLPNIRQVLSNKEPDINSIENIISREGKVEQYLKETPKAEPTKEAPKEPVSESELNKKKADIEKRRQEELGTVLIYPSLDENGRSINVEKNKAEDVKSAEINAKYDAELATLEKPAKPFAESFGTPVEDLSETLEGVSQTNLNGVDVLFSEVDGNTVKLESIETPEGEREQGKAKKALQKIIDKADELGKTIVLSVVPKDETTTEEGLRKLYEGFGFVATEGKNMERVPNAEVKETKSEVTPEVKEETPKTETENVEDINDKWEVVRNKDTPLGKSYSILNKETGETSSVIFPTEAQAKKQIESLKNPPKETPTTIESIEKKAETDLILSGESQKRRDDGEYERDGIVFKRNEEIKGDAGDKGVVRFAKNVEVPFTYKLIEAQSVQPSHQDAIRNPLHFIWEAQPKPRNDQGSVNAEDGFADSPRIKELGVNTNAYSGAPVVNSRGEVIQGNNRAAGLRKGYNRGNQAYKNDLAKNADKFGFTEEQVLKMKSPMLVRQVSATDALAIELGNYVVGDLETGSDSGINPVETARKIPATKRRAITEMLFRLDENGVIPTLNEAMRNNYEALKKLLADHLNTAQNNTIRKTSTPSPKALMELEGLIRQFLFEGGDPKISELFASLTSNQKNSIDKSLPSLFSVSPENSLISEVQNAILALSSFQSSGSESFNAWEKQSDVFNNNKTPRDVFTPTELYIAKLIAESNNTTDLRTKLTQYTEDVNGVEGGMFDDPIKPISKEDAIAKNFVKKTDSANKPGGNDAPIKKEGAPKPRTSKRTPKPVPPKVEPAKTDIDKRLEALKGETSKKADLAAEIAALKKSLWEDLNKQGFAQTPKQQGKDDAEFTNKLIQLAKLSIQQGLLSAADFIKEVLANYTGYRSKEEVTQMASDAFNEAKSEFDGNPPKKKRKSSEEMAKARKATSENEPKKQKKKAVVNRGVEGITSEEIKDALENTGLLYIVESHEEAAEIADDFIQRVGFDAALQSVRSETSGLTGAPKAILWGRLIDQVQETLDMETDPIKIVKLTSYIATLVDEFGIEAKKAGQFSSAMQFVYANSSFGYSLESQKSRYKAANNGVIEPAVQELFEQYDKQLKDVKKELIDVYEKLKEANEKAAFENLKNDLELDGEVSMPKPKMTAEARRRADKAIAVVRDIRTRIKANNYSDAVGITAAIDFGLGVIENGIEAGISVAEAIENGIAAIDNLMKDAPWKKDAFRKDVTKEFAKNNINTSSPKKKGQDPSDKGPTGIPRELLYALIKEEGINNIEDLTNAVMEELEIENTEENHRKTRDKITNYGKTRVATEGVAAELAKMTEIGRLISAIEDVQSGKRSKKSGFQRGAPSQKVRDMRRQLRELTKNLPMDEHDTAKYHKTALDAIKTRLRNKIADLTTERDTGIRLAKSSGKTTEYDAEANDLLEQIKILQIAHDEVFQKGVMSDEQRVELAITKLENAEKKFQHNIDVKNFTPPTREPEPNDPRVVAAREKMEAKKKEFKEAQIASGEVDSPEVIALERKVEAKKKAIYNLREKLFTGKIQPTTKTATGLVSQELIDLQKEHKGYLDQLNRARQAAKPRRSPEVIATENAVKAAERQLREIEDRIFNNQLDDIAKQSKVIQTAQLQFAKQKLADRKAFLRELQEQAGIPEKKRLEALKEAAKNRIAVMQERMKTSQYEKGKYKVKNGVVGAFTPLEKKKSPIDQELQDLLIKEMKIKEAYDVEVYRAELKNRSWPKKILDTAVEVSGLTRAVMATGEMSGVLIQGGKMLASHPQMTSRAIAEMFKQFASAKRAEDFINAVKSSEMYPELKAVKLAITDATQEGKLLAAEEAFVGGYVRHLWNAIGFLPLKAIPGKSKLFTPYDWAKAGLTGNYVEPQSAYERWEKLNPNEAFSRAQSGLLNYVRLSRYTQGRNMLIAQGKTFESHPEEYKDVAAYVNRATGRGGLGIAEPLAKPLSILLFSARNWASVMADVTPLVAYHYTKTGTSKNPFKPSVTQKMFMRDYLTWLGATASLVGLYMIASGDDEEDDRPKVELDPRSSNFMKMRVGNTYIDVFSGRQQMVVFQARMLSNSIKNGTSNKVYNLGQSAYTPTRGRLAWNLWKGKSNPSAGMFYKWLEKSTNQEGVDTDEFGQPYDATQNLIDNAYPMYWGTISELYEEQPDLVATALTGAAFFGLGAQTYGQNIGPVERAYLKIENEKRDKVTAVNEEISKKIDKEFDGQFINKNSVSKYKTEYSAEYSKSLGKFPKKANKTDVFNSIIEKHNTQVFKESASKELIEVSMNMGKASMRKPELIAKKLIDAEMYPMDKNTAELLKGALTASEYQKMNSTLTEYANWKASQKQAANKKSLSSSLTISLKSIFSN